MQNVYFHTHIALKHLESLKQVVHQESVILSFGIAKKIGYHRCKCIPCIQFCWLLCTDEGWIIQQSEVHWIHQLWVFPLWWREISRTGTWNSLLPCPMPLQIASSSQVWCTVAGEELSLVSTMVHTWSFFTTYKFSSFGPVLFHLLVFFCTAVPQTRKAGILCVSSLLSQKHAQSFQISTNFPVVLSIL